MIQDKIFYIAHVFNERRQLLSDIVWRLVT